MVLAWSGARVLHNLHRGTLPELPTDLDYGTKTVAVLATIRTCVRLLRDLLLVMFTSTVRRSTYVPSPAIAKI